MPQLSWMQVLILHEAVAEERAKRFKIDEQINELEQKIKSRNRGDKRINGK